MFDAVGISLLQDHHHFADAGQEGRAFQTGVSSNRSVHPKSVRQQRRNQQHRGNSPQQDKRANRFHRTEYIKFTAGPEKQGRKQGLNNFAVHQIATALIIRLACRFC